MTPYFGLASGYLTGKYRCAEDFVGKARGQGARKYFHGNGPNVLRALDALAAQTGASLAQLALSWLAHQPGVVAPIASATCVTQVEDLLGVLHLPLNTQQLALLERASAPTGGAPLKITDSD
jgi:aryl-alcohol dehydrogenase-like predicted oxidoreductase